MDLLGLVVWIMDAGILFDTADIDSSGSVDQEELRDILKALGVDMPESKVVDLFNELDTDKSGSLSFEEFIALLFMLKDLRAALDVSGITNQELDQHTDAAFKAVEFRPENVPPPSASGKLEPTITLGTPPPSPPCLAPCAMSHCRAADLTPKKGEDPRKNFADMKKLGKGAFGEVFLATAKHVHPSLCLSASTAD
jgi:hypothetical protein